MKKLAVASAVLAALTTSAAFASVSVDAYNDYNFDSRKNKQGIELGYSPIENLGLTAEVTTDKDLDLGVAYKFDIAENFYVKPSFGYVVKWGDDDDFKMSWKDKDPIFDAFTTFEQSGSNSNVYKLALETGAKFGDFFASARYRFEIDAKSHTVELSGPNKASLELYKERSRVGRTDLMVGYNIADAVTVTAKGIHRSQLNKDIRNVNNDFTGQANSFWTSEVKATLTSIDGVLPYVQYARNYETRD